MKERILIETKIQDRYNKFLNYCIDSKKFFIDELNETDFVAYRAKYSVSREEIKILKTLLTPQQSEINLFAELDSKLSDEKSMQTLQKIFNIKDPESYKNILLIDLPFNNRVRNQLKKNKCITLIELLNYSMPELSALQNFGSSSIKNVLDVLEHFFYHSPIFQKNISEKSEGNFEQQLLDGENLKNFAKNMITAVIKNEKQYDVICGRAEGKTLEEIGKSFGLTRERVRQIEKTAVTRFSRYNSIKLKNFFDSICKLLKEKNFITFENLKNFTDETSAKIIWFFVFKTKIFHLDENTNAIILQKSNQEQPDYDKLINDLPKVLREDELQNEVNRILEEQNCSEEFLKLKISQIYKRSGKFFHKSRLTLNFQCGYILREIFQNGYKISDETHYSRFIRYLREFFDYKGEISQRALDAKISSYIGVLCDRGKYIHPDFLHIPQKITLLINDYIENSDRTVLPYKEIFTALKKIFVGTQINNQYILQGVIKYCGTPYNLFKDYLTKKTDINLAAEFNSFVEKNGEVSTQEIKAEFISFQDYNIALLLQQCPEVIYIGNEKYLHSTQLNLLENDFSDFEFFLNRTCADSPVSSRYLFNLFWENFQDFLYRNGIEDSEKLFGVLKYMFGEKFKFSRPYISATDITGITNKKVLLKYFEDRDEIEIENILNLCEEHGIKYVAKTVLIESLSPEFIRIDEFYLRRPKSIGVNDEVISSVIENIQLTMERNGGWQSAKTFPDFEWLPHLKVSWNSFLLESIVKLSQNNLKILHSSTNFGEFSTAIFVSEDFEEDNFNSFCLKILIDEHEREPFQTKEEIFNWLKEKGLINKKLPKIIEEHLTVTKNRQIILQEI